MNDSPVDLSVIMATYNHERTIAEAIESVLNQETEFSIRLHVLNDSSTDNTAHILREYAEQYPERIKVYTSPENLGSGKANFYYHKPNTNSDYWTLLAGDDYWLDKQKIQKQLTLLNENKNYIGCSCNTLVNDEVNQTKSVIEPYMDEWNLYDMINYESLYPFYVHPSGIVWRNIYRDTSSFLPPKFRIPEAKGDVMLFHIMLSAGMKIRHLRETLSCYRVTGEGVWSKLSKEEQTRINNNLADMLFSLWPLKYKLYAYLIKIRRWYKRNYVR